MPRPHISLRQDKEGEDSVPHSLFFTQKGSCVQYNVLKINFFVKIIKQKKQRIGKKYNFTAIYRELLFY